MFALIFTRDKRGKREVQVLTSTLVILGADYFLEIRETQILVFVK